MVPPGYRNPQPRIVDESPLLPYLARSNICLINQGVSPMTVPTSIRECQIDNSHRNPATLVTPWPFDTCIIICT